MCYSLRTFVSSFQLLYSCVLCPLIIQWKLFVSTACVFPFMACAPTTGFCWSLELICDCVHAQEGVDGADGQPLDPVSLTLARAHKPTPMNDQRYTTRTCRPNLIFKTKTRQNNMLLHTPSEGGISRFKTQGRRKTHACVFWQNPHLRFAALTIFGVPLG